MKMRNKSEGDVANRADKHKSKLVCSQTATFIFSSILREWEQSRSQSLRRAPGVIWAILKTID